MAFVADVRLLAADLDDDHVLNDAQVLNLAAPFVTTVDGADQVSTVRVAMEYCRIVAAYHADTNPERSTQQRNRVMELLAMFRVNPDIVPFTDTIPDLPSNGGGGGGGDGGLTTAQVNDLISEHRDVEDAHHVKTPPGTGSGGLDQDEVDARVRAGVEDWAETGNATLVPGPKLTPSAPGTRGGVEGSTNAIADTASGTDRLRLVCQPSHTPGQPAGTGVGSGRQHHCCTGHKDCRQHRAGLRSHVGDSGAQGHHGRPPHAGLRWWWRRRGSHRTARP